MLDHIHIQNYRLFKDLKIDKLGQVNLIAGKNNTGKTALLEALRILASKIEPSVLANILHNRGTFEKNRNIENLQTLFPNFFIDKSIRINSYNLKLNKNDLLIEVVISDKETRSKRYNIPLINIEEYKNPREGLVLISFTGDFEYSGWENFTIEEEDNIIEILKLIEPKVVDFRIIDSNKPVLRLEGLQQRQPINSLGDGVNRIFTIAFSLVKAKNKILLIDEFEVGLHYSIQKQLWEIIFKYAKEWNIQVFATTHSQDTIENLVLI